MKVINWYHQGKKSFPIAVIALLDIRTWNLNVEFEKKTLGYPIGWERDMGFLPDP